MELVSWANLAIWAILVLGRSGSRGGSGLILRLRVCWGSCGHFREILESRVRPGIRLGPRSRVGVILRSRAMHHIGTRRGYPWIAFDASGSWGHPRTQRCLKVVWGSHDRGAQSFSGSVAGRARGLCQDGYTRNGGQEKNDRGRMDTEEGKKKDESEE